MLYKILTKIKYKILLQWIKPEMLPFRYNNSSIISGTCVSNMTHVSYPKNVNIGEKVFIGHFSYIDGYRKVNIGKGCQISNYVSILTHSSHDSLRLDPDGKNKYGLMSGDVEIGEFCFIGSHCVIMPGSKIGKGSIISSYTFVSGEFPEYSILRGQPARIVGDTKTRDLDFLSENPDAKSSYYE